MVKVCCSGPKALAMIPEHVRKKIFRQILVLSAIINLILSDQKLCKLITFFAGRKGNLLRKYRSILFELKNNGGHLTSYPLFSSG